MNEEDHILEIGFITIYFGETGIVSVNLENEGKITTEQIASKELSTEDLQNLLLWSSEKLIQKLISVEDALNVWEEEFPE